MATFWESAVARRTVTLTVSFCLQVSHVFSNIRRGVRFVSFEHWGQDTQFWAGHYGARVTNSSVIVQVCQS